MYLHQGLIDNVLLMIKSNFKIQPDTDIDTDTDIDIDIDTESVWSSDSELLKDLAPKILKLQSKFIFNILRNNNETPSRWFKYNKFPNTITKLQYQYRYRYRYQYYNLINFFMDEMKWEYIKGPVYFDQYIMYDAAKFGYISIFKLCVDKGIITFPEVLNNEAHCGNTEILELYLQHGFRFTDKQLDYEPEILKLIEKYK